MPNKRMVHSLFKESAKLSTQKKEEIRLSSGRSGYLGTHNYSSFIRSCIDMQNQSTAESLVSEFHGTKCNIIYIGRCKACYPEEGGDETEVCRLEFDPAEIPLLNVN